MNDVTCEQCGKHFSAKGIKRHITRIHGKLPINGYATALDNYRGLLSQLESAKQQLYEEKKRLTSQQNEIDKLLAIEEGAEQP